MTEKTEHYSAYVTPNDPEIWKRITQGVIASPIVEDNRPIFSTLALPENRSADTSSEHRIFWLDPEHKRHDFAHFFLVDKIIIDTLLISDEEFARLVPHIFSILSKTHIFGAIGKKMSPTQNGSIQDHIESVPTLLETSQLSLIDRFILRKAAIYHDIGKAFEFGTDQLQLHALAGANISNQYLSVYENQIVDYFKQFEKQHGIEDKPSDNYEYIQSQTTELIRLHHVLEKIDKGELTLEVVAEIAVKKDINLGLLGLLAVADGGSVIHKKAIYAEHLVNNLNRLAELVDHINLSKALQSKTIPHEVKLSFVQALQHLLTQLLQKVEGLAATIEKLLADTIDKLDQMMAVALYSMVNQPIAQRV